MFQISSHLNHFQGFQGYFSIFYCSKLTRTKKTIGYCLRTADSIKLVFVPKDAYHRNLDSQQVSGLQNNFSAFGGKISGGGGRIDPPRVQVGLRGQEGSPPKMTFLLFLMYFLVGFKNLFTELKIFVRSHFMDGSILKITGKTLCFGNFKAK